MKRIFLLMTAVVLLCGMTICGTAAAEKAELPELPEGVVPVTWEPSPEHLIIETEEARALYERIVAGDYPTMEELKASPVVAQLDALSDYYKAVYGNTMEISTPEREALREEIKEQFLSIGSARIAGVNPRTNKVRYSYDGPLSYDYQMILVLGLPASGKSSYLVDPISTVMGGFILDCDTVKELIPEFRETYGCAADAVHFESFEIMHRAMQEFLTGKMKGANVLLPIVASDLDELMETYIKPFEEAGYRVKAIFREAAPNEAAARVIMRDLATGRIINSAVAFSFGDKPEEVYNELSTMINSKGETYGFSEEEELEPAA